jgi:hypothetical protein
MGLPLVILRPLDRIRYVSVFDFVYSEKITTKKTFHHKKKKKKKKEEEEEKEGSIQCGILLHPIAIRKVSDPTC